MTLAEVAVEIGKTPRAVELAKGRPLASFDVSTQALAGGLIEMAPPDKPTSRLQQYRLTAAGHTRLQALATRGKPA